MCEETIVYKDGLIVSLSEELNSTIPGSASVGSPLVDPMVEPYHESVKVGEDRYKINILIY